MHNPLIIGLDLGTTLCKAFAFELDGTVAGSSQKPIKTYRPHPGWAEQDPTEWETALVEVLNDLVSQLGKDKRRIEAIGLSCHGPCLIPADKNYRPLWRCPTWQDQRSAHLVEPLLQLAGVDWIGLGTPESSFGVQLYWAIQNRKDLLDQASYLFDTKGYLNAFLTGCPVDEPSSSPGSKDDYNPIFEALGIDTQLLPGSVPSISVVGGLTPDLQRRLNLSSNVKIVAGLNDGAAATLGAGIVKQGQGIVSLSTNGVMRTTINKPMPGSTLFAKSMFCYSYVDNMFITGGMTKCGGDNVKWLLENFYPEEENDPGLFEKITALADESPVGANGVLFMPYLLGQKTTQPTGAGFGAFLNLHRHNNQADFARSLFEGTAFALKEISETFNELGLPWENLHFSGGGSKNDVWRQIVADILGRPLTGVKSDSVLGVALLAAASLGYFNSIKDAVDSMVETTFNIQPVEENIMLYEQIYTRFKHGKRLVSELD